MAPKNDKPSRVLILSRVVVFGFVIAALSQARVQIVERSTILNTAKKDSRFIVTKTDLAKKGWIMSSDGKPLAQDEDSSILTMDFTKVPKANAFYMDMSAATGIPASEFAQLAHSELKSNKRGQQLCEWKEPLSGDEAKAVMAVKTDWRADGISVTQSGRRSYPLGDAASGIVGIVKDKVAYTGIEKGEQKILGGINGIKTGLVDRQGHLLPGRLDNTTKERVDGQTIELTIDSELQLAAAKAIRDAVESNKADQGTAIIIDPKTGDLLAMANWPSVDPSTLDTMRTKANSEWGFDTAYMAKLEPGSMFKILTLAKALDCGAITPDEDVYCHGAIQIGNHTIKCDKGETHGVADIQTAIAESCNISALTWALRIGHDRFIDYADKLGIFKKTNIGLPGEVPGFYNRRETATYLQTATMGFGQSMACTPVGLASALSMIGNHGFRMEPRLIKKIGNVEQPLRPAGQMVAPATAQRVLGIMRAVIGSDEGTGHSLRIPGYDLGGKTGTAQKVGTKKRVPDPANPGKFIYVPDHGYVANFVGFVPAQEPRAMILVMIDNPQAGKYYGASVAGPVFVELAKAAIRKFGLTPTLSPEMQKALVESYKDRQPSGHIITVPPPPDPRIERDARREADRQAKLAAKNNPLTHVLSAGTSPAPSATMNATPPGQPSTPGDTPATSSGPEVDVTSTPVPQDLQTLLAQNGDNKERPRRHHRARRQK